ncbi:MAG: hypothetical protein QOE82_2652 [Thermoanaerobaculia bacterium]|jgi:hypothetical protein|nr:hypothetical protein [Thermoanaerobaculia bacterium]
MAFKDLFSRRSKPRELFGHWRLIDDQAGVDQGDGVGMTFHPDGRLEYAIHDEDRVAIMNLVWHVEGDVIVSDQPSSPREERTRYFFRSPDVLVLENADGRSTFQRM